MTRDEAINWIINLTADIGKVEHRDLWHYERVGVRPAGKRVAWERKNPILPDVRKRFACEMREN